MRYFFFAIPLLLLIAICCGSGCTNDPKTPPVETPILPVVEVNDLVGQWKLSGAERNGSLTNSLDGIYFNFTQTDSLYTNFNPAVTDRAYTYIVSGKTIEANGPHQQAFTIDTLNDQQLILQTKLAGANFKLMLTPNMDHEEQLRNEI